MFWPERSGLDFFFGMRFAGGTLAMVRALLDMDRALVGHVGSRLERRVFRLRCAPRIGGLLGARSSGVAARTPGRPRVVAVAAAAAATSAGGAAGTAALSTTGITGNLGRGVLQRRPDLVDVDLEDGPALALAGLVAAGLQPAVDDDPHAFLQRLGNVLRSLSPDGAVKEHRIAVTPL